MKAFGILITAKSLSSLASMIQLSRPDYVDTVGDLEYYFEWKTLCLFKPDTVLPLVFPSLFFFRYM